jgi:hypothetical protein
MYNSFDPLGRVALNFFSALIQRRANLLRDQEKRFAGTGRLEFFSFQLKKIRTRLEF